EVPGGVTAYLGAGDREDLGAVHRAHDLAAPGRNPGMQQEPVEVDALIAQRIALVDADRFEVTSSDRGPRLASEEQMGGSAGDGARFQGVALMQPVEAVPESDAAAEHDRDQHNVQVVDQVSLQELVDRRRPAAKPYVQVSGRLLCLSEDLGRGG